MTGSFEILSEHNLQCPAGSISLNYYAVYPHPGLSVEGQVSYRFRSHKTSKMFRKNGLYHGYADVHSQRNPNGLEPQLDSEGWMDVQELI